MQPFEIYEWLSPTWHTLLSTPSTLPHALLLTGRAGVGKGSFAQALAARLLCETTDVAQFACGQCNGCRLVAAGNHPDFRKVFLEELVTDDIHETTLEKKGKSSKKTAPPSTQIKIQQIRSLEDFVYVGSHRQGKRVVIIDPADAMNTAAANALLKILEEPPSSIYFILVTSKERHMLATLRSRCRSLAFPMPPAATAISWLTDQKLPKPSQLLALASGSPLRALALARDGVADIIDEAITPLLQRGAEPVALAAQWENLRRRHPAFDLESLVDSLQKWVYDVGRAGCGVAPRYFTDRGRELAALAATASEPRLQRCYADLLKIRAVAKHPLNELLLLEDMAARCIAGLSLAGRSA